eukprot:193355_1
MRKRSRDYLQSFEEHQRLCAEHNIGSPPPLKKFKTNTNNNSSLPPSLPTSISNLNTAKTLKQTEHQISLTIKKSLQIKLNNSSFDLNKKIAKETINILTNGYYKANKKLIQIKTDHNNSFNNTILYHSNNEYKFCELKQNKFNKMDIEIINETTLNGCYNLSNDLDIINPVALNFASAQIPGGSFKNGSKAQEESLCRGSSLHGTLIKYKNEFYKYHKNVSENKMLYSDSIIYSPNVLIFRDYNDNLMDNYYLCSFISSPAVNCKEFMKRSKKSDQISKTMVYDAMKKRIDKILNVAVKHKHDGVVLGSFGCGKFGNDINSIAEIFAMLLATKYKFCFRKVRFSCLEMNEVCYFIQVFESAIRKWFKINK